MKTYKITFNDKNFIITGFNGTFEEAQDYYIGNTFNFGIVKDKLRKAIKVEEVN